MWNPPTEKNLGLAFYSLLAPVTRSMQANHLSPKIPLLPTTSSQHLSRGGHVSHSGRTICQRNTLKGPSQSRA